MANFQLVLATSKYRQQLIAKLSVPFITASPDCDETPNESLSECLVKRLAKLKQNLAITQPSLIIGSDQVCVINGEIIGKPHNRQTAIEQLSHKAEKSFGFYRPSHSQ